MLEYNKLNIRTWSLLGPSGAHGIAAMELAESNENVLMLTADLCFFSGLERFKATHSDRLYDVGIAEQNMIGIAAGLAKEGFCPFANTYASFCTSRCADQVRVNMSYMKLPIKLIGLTSGFGAGVLGATHVSLEDIAVMRALPNITVISPADCTEIIKAMLAVARTPDPTYIRLTGPMNTPIVYKEDYDFEIGKAIELKDGNDVCILASGSIVAEALKASKLLEKDGISVSVVNIHTIKPLDKDFVCKVANKYGLLFTIEEHSIYGGLGSAIAEVLVEKRMNTQLEIIGINDFFPSAGDYRYQLEQCGLTAVQIADRIRKVMKGGS
mgnify:CR=1 FL=1